MPVFGGVEAGGTKFICIYGSGPDDIRAEIRIPTTSPQETFRHVIRFFQEPAKTGELKGIGIGSFGPVDLVEKSQTYGYITSTPKPGWQDVNFVGTIQDALGLPIAFDTDVNAAAYGEWTWGAAQGLQQFIYLTIGTGIGGGALINGHPLHGLIHPEMGHILIPHNLIVDPFPGACPYHGDCFEGLASGPSIKARWGIPAENLTSNQVAWDLESEYIAYALMNFICTLSPQRIILGGGVMQHSELFPEIRTRTRELLNRYIHSQQILEHIHDYIVPPGLGKSAGVLGALAMAKRLVNIEG
jgi:fructokinase